MDQEYPVAMHKLDGCLTKDMLLNVCDCKGSDDLVVFKCNEEKLLQWLSKKVSDYWLVTLYPYCQTIYHILSYGKNICYSICTLLPPSFVKEHFFSFIYPPQQLWKNNKPPILLFL